MCGRAAHTGVMSRTTPPFEPPAWDERYAGTQSIWSGNANAQLVAEASRLTPGTALDVGCGEGGDVIWLAQQGWRVTGADFSANGLERAARHAEDHGDHGDGGAHQQGGAPGGGAVHPGHHGSRPAAGVHRGAPARAD